MAKKTPFEKEIHTLLKSLYPLVIRQYDMLGQRFTSKKPADFFACDRNGLFVLVEAKSTRSGSFPLNRIKLHQREAMDTVHGTSYGRAFLALNLRDRKGPGRAWLIPWCHWKRLEKSLNKQSVRSSDLNRLEFCELKRITSGWEIAHE